MIIFRQSIEGPDKKVFFGISIPSTGQNQKLFQIVSSAVVWSIAAVPAKMLINIFQSKSKCRQTS